MDLIPLFILALAPGLFWLWYFYHRDRYAPEPLAWIARIFFLGVVITIPVAFVEGIFSFFTSTFFLTVVIVPVVEEYGKYSVVRRTVYRSIEFDEPVDGIVYATAAALGFATLENVFYVFSSYETSFSLAISTAIIRAAISVPGHALFSSMWGYALGQAKFMPPEEGERVIIWGLFLAIAFHGLFNFLLYDSIGMALLILVVVPLMWLIVNDRIKRALSGFPRTKP